jgi:hypothetical protein
MAEPRACRDQIVLKKGKCRLAGARSEEYGGCDRRCTFSDFKNYFASSDVCDYYNEADKHM